MLYIIKRFPIYQAHRILILSLFLISSLGSAQELKNAVVYEGPNYTGLAHLVKDRQFVMLGEQTHGDGATFDEKVRLIKYLHEQYGFNTIAFESGLYDNYKASQMSKELNSSAPFASSIMGLWSGQQMFAELLEYIESRKAMGHTINIMGFDNQYGPLFENYFIEDLRSMFKSGKITLPSAATDALEKALVYRDIQDASVSKADSLALYGHFDDVLKSFDQIRDPGTHEKILRQVLLGSISDISEAIRELQNQKAPVQNPRDMQMARNLVFLAETFPTEKMICWGASYHFAKSLGNIGTDAVTLDYLRKQGELELKILGHRESNIKEISDLTRAVTMGMLLKEKYSDKVLTIGFSSYEGSYKGSHDRVFPILQPPEQSIEYQLAALGYNNVFIDLSKTETDEYYSSALGNIPLKASWPAVFDGLVFIKESYPPLPRKYEEAALLNRPKMAIRGKIVDEKSQAINSYADITLLLSGRGSVANKLGEFAFEIDGNKINDKLVISAFGYKTDTLAISAGKSTYLVKLRKESDENIILDEVTITTAGKKLSSEEIIAKARDKVKDNYIRHPYNQKFFYQNQTKRNDKILFNEEASVMLYNEKGLTGFNRVAGNFFGQILEFRNTTGNYSQDKWSGVGNLWTLLERNLILSKANVLYRTSSYTCVPPERIRYNDREVYLIYFINNSPGAFSTGYGYPSPVSSSGAVYIDTKTFAIYKYEHCVVRAEREIKKMPDRKYQASHNITETYREVDGQFFVNFSREITREKVISKKDNSISHVNYYVSTLMSEEIITDNVTVLKNPIDEIKKTIPVSPPPQAWKPVPSFEDQNSVDNFRCN